MLHFMFVCKKPSCWQSRKLGLCLEAWALGLPMDHQGSPRGFAGSLLLSCSAQLGWAGLGWLLH